MNTETLKIIDGSIGEGGGQVLRSSLALSVLTGTPMRIVNIRAGRKKSGLLRQHLTAVRAAVAVSGASVEGAELRSSELEFRPSGIFPGEHHFAVGTAGSAVLVAQTILPILLNADAPSTLVVEGGTHNSGAPPFDHFARSFVPALRRLGVRISARIERHGFVPAGGGRIVIDVEPATELQPHAFVDRGEIIDRRARAIVSGVPRHVAERELRRVGSRLGWSEGQCEVVEIDDSPGPGNVVFAEVESEFGRAIFTSFGRRGVRAERVADEVVAAARDYLASSAPVDEHLADQLLLPLALAGGGSVRTNRLTRHTTTNLEVIDAFLPLNVNIETLGPNDHRIDLEKRAP